MKRFIIFVVVCSIVGLLLGTAIRFITFPSSETLSYVGIVILMITVSILAYFMRPRYRFLLLGAVLCSSASYFLSWFIFHDLVLQKLLDPEIYKNTVAIVIRDKILPWGVFVFFLWQIFRATSITLPPGKKGVLLFLEKRTRVILDEGLNWGNIPMVLGLLQVNAQTQSIEITVTNVISKDNVTIEKIIARVQFAIIGFYKSTQVDSGVEKALTGLLESEMRNKCSKLHAVVIPKVPRDLASSILNDIDLVEEGNEEDGFNLKKDDTRPKKSKQELEEEASDYYPGDKSDSFSGEAGQWGVVVKDIFITKGDLPQDVVNALNQERQERAQKTAQGIEADNIVGLFEKLKATGLPVDRAQQTVHAITCKPQPSFFLEGSAGDLSKAAALISGAVKTQQKGAE